MIRIYYMKLDGDCSKEQSLAFLNKDATAGLYNMLPEERRQAVDRAKSEEIAMKRLYTGAFLQHVLSEETGVSVERLCYRYNAWGKPELDVESILRDMEWDAVTRSRLEQMHFNLSHSGDYVVLALSDSPVGIDVEHKTRGYEAVSKRCFCKEEYADIMSRETDIERAHRFLEYWTMKEAYIKCVGEGMRIPLNSFLVDTCTDWMSVVRGQEKYLGSFFLGNAYCVSVCSASKASVETMVKQREQSLQIFTNEIHR